MVAVTSFYAQVYDFLGLRLTLILGIGNGGFSAEVSHFQKDLGGIIKKYQSKLLDGTTLGELFILINQA